MNPQNIFRNLKWKSAATFATSGIALLFVGCVDDEKELYNTTAEQEEKEPVATGLAQDQQIIRESEFRHGQLENQQLRGVAQDDQQRTDGTQPSQRGAQSESYAAVEQQDTAQQSAPQREQQSAQPQDQGQAAQQQAESQPERDSQHSQLQSSQQDAQRSQQQTSEPQQERAQSAQQPESQQREPLAEMAPEDAEVQDSTQVALKEENLEVEKREVPAGGILLRKKVDTEEANETVELRREEIEVARVSPEEAQQRQEGSQAEFNESFSEEEVFIPEMREEAVAEKEVEAREVVAARKDTQTEQREVDTTIRREELEVERVGEAGPDADQQQASASASQNQESENLKSLVVDRLRNGDVELSEREIEQIEIQIENDTVILSGTAPSEEIKSQIEEEVASIEQVSSVQNNLST